MRDAILMALDNKLTAGHLDTQAHASARNGIWGVFARFGMGPQARSNGASLHGIFADFTAPPPSVPPSENRVEITPSLAIPDANLDGMKSEIDYPRSGSIRHLIVAVDIRHTFVGKVADLVGQDTGVLNKWSLELTYSD